MNSAMQSSLRSSSERKKSGTRNTTLRGLLRDLACAVFGECPRIAISALTLLAVDVALGLFCLVYPSFLAIRLFYNFNTLYLPLALGALSIVGFVAWSRQPYKRWIARGALLFTTGAIGLFGVRVYATHVEPYRLQVQHVTIQTAKVEHPFRILHISDIQSSRIVNYEREVFAQVRALAPDLIVFTGDLLQPIPPATFESESPKMAALLSSVNPSNGILGVRGDVDDFLPRDLGGLRWLNNESVRIATGAGALNILGLSSNVARRPLCTSIVNDWLTRTPANDFTLLIAHPPDFALHIPDAPVDLCLAGHTHGGQIRLPMIGPLFILSKVPHRLARGFHPVGRTRLNVSAGIGCEHASGLPAIRVYCPPEMTLIELVPATPMPLTLAQVTEKHL